MVLHVMSGNFDVKINVLKNFIRIMSANNLKNKRGSELGVCNFTVPPQLD